MHSNLIEGAALLEWWLWFKAHPISTSRVCAVSCLSRFMNSSVTEGVKPRGVVDLSKIQVSTRMRGTPCQQILPAVRQ